MSLKDRIINGDATIGIVGLGYIGFSTAAHYANAGANVIGVDLDKVKVESFNKGTVYIDNIEYWLGFDYSPLVTKYNRARASLSYDSLRNSEVVFVAIPTERDGEPYMDILKSVVADLSKVVPD